MKMINFVMLKDFVLQLQSFLGFFQQKSIIIIISTLILLFFLVSLHPNFV